MSAMLLCSTLLSLVQAQGLPTTQFSTDGMLSAETNRYRLDPKQSYVSRDVRAGDPTFWGPPPTLTRPRAAPATRP